jgi:hypothetical protein
MEALLETWHRLRLDEGASPESLCDFLEAQALLKQSADIPNFLSRLRGELDTPPASAS